MDPTVSAYHEADVGPDGLCRLPGCGRRAIAHLTTRADAFRRLDKALELNGYASSVETSSLVKEIVRADNAQAWPPRPTEFTPLQKALIARAVNTEINLLRRLYGSSSGTHMGALGAHTFEEQVRALEAVDDILFPPRERRRLPGQDVVDERGRVNGCDRSIDSPPHVVGGRLCRHG